MGDNRPTASIRKLPMFERWSRIWGCSQSAAAIQLLNFMFSTAADGALARVGGALQKF